MKSLIGRAPQMSNINEKLRIERLNRILRCK